MNISIRCSDNMYKFGLTALLREIFSPEMSQQTLSIQNVHSKNRPADDVVTRPPAGRTTARAGSTGRRCRSACPRRTSDA